MAWERVVLKVSGSTKPARMHRRYWLCPKCDGKVYSIPYHARDSREAVATQVDERSYQILICDRCGQIMAFEGCTGDCETALKSRCEVCGKYYCQQCGITEDIHIDDKLVELRYCNDHIPEWYRNR